jgi:hypothetical protein
LDGYSRIGVPLKVFLVPRTYQMEEEENSDNLFFSDYGGGGSANWFTHLITYQ